MSAPTDKTASGKSAPPKLPRAPKGVRPQYFHDPATDKLLHMVLAMAAELSATRDRLDTVERFLEQHGIASIGQIDCYDPPPEVDAARAERRKGEIARIMRIVEKDLEEKTRPDMPTSREEIVKIVDR
jgi:hypothetical protein